MPTGTPRQAMYGEVLTLISHHGSTYAEQIASKLNVNIKTARRILSDLAKMGIIVRVGTTRSPAIYEKAPKSDKARLPNATEPKRTFGGNDEGNVQTDEEVDFSNVGCDAPTLTVRASAPAEVRDIPGFVAWPHIHAYHLTKKFGRGHLAGPVVVTVAEVGRTPETFALPDTRATGAFMATAMKGNTQLTGHVRLANDPDPVRLKALTTKDGDINKLQVFPHWRWIRQVPGGTIEAVMEEMGMQTVEVIQVLEAIGWRFESFKIDPAKVHFTLENGIAQHVDSPYVWNDGDELHFDRSMGYPEAEIYGSSPTANDDIDLMANLPSHVREMEDAIQTANISIAEIADHTTTLAGHVTALTDTMTAMVDAVNVLVKMATPAKYEKGEMDKESERIIYGRHRLHDPRHPRPSYDDRRGRLPS